MYYISELHMMDNEDGIPKLADHTDTFGPYKSLKSARKDFIKKVCNSKFLKHWDFMIRGPRKINRFGYKSEWYTPITRQYSYGNHTS